MAVAISDGSSLSKSILHPLWHDTTPAKLRQQYSHNTSNASWSVWKKHLRRRKRPAAQKFLRRKEPAILWGWPPEWQYDAIEALLRNPEVLAELALGDDKTSGFDLPSTVQMVALAYAMPALAEHLPAQTWWVVLERLHVLAIEAGTEQLKGLPSPEVALRHQLLAGELPLALSYLFPELRLSCSLQDEARSNLSESLIELTDGQGLPHGRLLPIFGPLFACWTRCRWLGKRMREGAWSQQAEKQYRWLVRHAIRLADSSGRFVLSQPTAAGAHLEADGRNKIWTAPLFKMALKLSGDAQDYAAARRALPRGVTKRTKKNRRSTLPDASLNSEWAGMTVMAGGWRPSDVRVALDYSSDKLLFEVAAQGRTLLCGLWTSQTIADGRRLEPAGEWDQLFWKSTPKFDFLELGQDLTGGIRLERQILLGRVDRILYLADNVRSTGTPPARLEHSLLLPLAAGVGWTPESETRDGLLSVNKTCAAVLPLSLKEWRADTRGGSLSERAGQLTLAQETDAGALSAALLIDLDHKRSRAERTWRQLTVAEWMEIIPSHVAVGYRAQSGDDQWLFYRSLGPVGNRTVLGHNVAGEFCAGRFDGGKFKEWVEIEAV